MPARSPLKGSQKLADLQKMMAQALMRPLRSGDRLERRVADGSPTERVVQDFIKPNDRLSSFERIQIYNQQYWWRLFGSFAEDYNGLRAVLGPRKFDRLAVAYIEAFGSESWTMRNLGRHLVDY